ncbi:phage tail tape measure protein [Lactiplantibacillus plantarum]|nr:phage tail tape measure protein [Lactiplantibacillus plantarum]
MADEVLGRMVIELGLDHAAFGKGLTGAKREVKYAMAEMKSSMAVLGQSGRRFDVLSAKSKGLSQVMMSQQRVVEKLGKAYKDSLVDGKPTAQTAKLATQLQNANAKLASLQTQYKNNAAAMAKARVEQTGFTGGLNKVSKAAVATGTSMKNIGSTMTSKVSAPIAAGLAIATKSAITFDSQIKSMGPLLTNGGAVTAKYRSQLDQLGDASKKMSMKYGVSTTEINNGMAELIRRGYTTNQVLGSMPSILDATMASGEDMGTVMNATASIVEQFGLKTNSTAGTMKNTQRVTDSLTYAANATAAGFGDMSDAMSYVGPVASSLGLSVEQTAAAVGELSNQGIEGQKAGTNLRGMLTSLIKPTKQNTEGFKSMGISSKQLAHDSHDLPQLIDDITHGTKGWSNAERGKALAQAFGRENQAAANALVKAGSKSLRDLTKDTENAGGATKKVAEQMSNTSANNVKKLIASLQVLGIEIGEKLIPKLTPLVKKATDMVQGFSKMDDATQNTIIKFALLAAAGGPVLSMLGNIVGGFGTFGGGIVKIISKTAQWHAKNQAAKESLAMLKGATDATSGGFKAFKGSVDTVNGSASTAKSTFGLLKGAFTTAEAGAGVLGTSLSVTGAAVTGVGLAAVAGVAYWQLYGKEAAASAARTRQWGSDIGEQADSALTKFKGFSTNASASLTDFETASHTSTKSVAKDFGDMYTEMEKDSKDTIQQMQEDMKGLPDSVQDDLKEDIADRKKHNATVLADAKENYNNAEAILKNHNGKMSGLSDTERTALLNSQRKMNSDEISLLKIGGSAKKNVLAALNGDIGNMTRKQRDTTINQLTSSMQKENKLYNDQSQQIKSMYDKGEISASQYGKAMTDLQATHKSTTDGMAAAIYKLDKANGTSKAQITQDLLNVGYTYKQAAAIVKRQNDDMSKSTSLVVAETGNMSKKSKAAADTWNSLVFDSKTGKVKTNAQAEVNKAAKSKDKWNAMLLLAKQGKMSSNAAAMVGIAAVQTKRWDGLTLKEKQAMIKSKGGDDLAGLIEKGKQWGKFTPAEKKAIITSKGGPELLGVMTKAQTWNKLTMAEKRAVLKDNASPAMKQASVSVKEWNNLTPQMKTVMAKAKGAEDVAKGVRNVKDWNSLPTVEKKLIANDKGATGIIKKVTGNYKAYQNLPKNVTKNLFAKDNASKNAGKAKISVDKFGRVKVTGKVLKATDKASGPAKSGKKGLDKFNSTKMQTKTAKGKDSASGSMNGARKSAMKYNGVNMALKTARGHDAASSPINGAHRSLDRYNGVGMRGKTARGYDSASGAMGRAKGSLGRYNGTGMRDKTARGHDGASGPISSAIRTLSHWNAMGNVTHFITTVFRKITRHATGTTGTDGNPIIVNDEESSVFREAVKYPGHPAFIPHGRNVYLNAPKGTQVIPAGLTAKMFGVSQYAAGTIPANSSIIQASKAINDSIGGDNTTINYNLGGSDSTQAIVAGLEAILNKLDGQQPTFEVHNDMIGEKLRTLIKQKDSREHNLNRFFPQGG